MVHSKYFYYDLNLQCCYDTNKYICQFLTLKFNGNIMLWCAETEFSVKP